MRSRPDRGRSLRTLTSKVKKQITNDWAMRFPSFAIYRPLHLLRRIGPILSGIRLERDSSNRTYLPMLHVHSLCRRFPVVSLTANHPLLTTRTRAPDHIEVRDHTSRFQETANRLEHQAAMPLYGNVSLDSIIHFYQSYIRNENVKVANVYEDQISYAVWVNQISKASELIESAVTAIRAWPPERRGQVDIDHLRRSWVSLLQQRETLISTYEKESEHLRVGHLPASNLLP